MHVYAGDQSAGPSFSSIIANPDLQLRTDSLGFTPLLAPLSPLPPVRMLPLQPQLFKRHHSLGEVEQVSQGAIEVAAFDCSSSNDSCLSLGARQDARLTGQLLPTLCVSNH